MVSDVLGTKVANARRQKVFTRQAVPVEPSEEPKAYAPAGLALHAGIGVEADERGKLERLCLYARPAVAKDRLARTERALRAAITPARRDARHTAATERAVPKHVAMSWMHP